MNTFIQLLSIVMIVAAFPTRPKSDPTLFRREIALDGVSDGGLDSLTVRDICGEYDIIQYLSLLMDIGILGDQVDCINNDTIERRQLGIPPDVTYITTSLIPNPAATPTASFALPPDFTSFKQGAVPATAKLSPSVMNVQDGAVAPTATATVTVTVTITQLSSPSSTGFTAPENVIGFSNVPAAAFATATASDSVPQQGSGGYGGYGGGYY